MGEGERRTGGEEAAGDTPQPPYSEQARTVDADPTLPDAEADVVTAAVVAMATTTPETVADVTDALPGRLAAAAAVDAWDSRTAIPLVLVRAAYGL